MKLRLLALMLGLGVAGLAAPHAPAPAQPAQRDWSRTIVATPEGYRIGNPAARVKLVEYGSFTCPACANFSRTAKSLLVANHVRSGRVSFEFRNMVLNGPGIAATLLARCAGPASFFRIADSLYQGQDLWLGRIRALGQARLTAAEALALPQRMSLYAETGGLYALAARGGIPPARARACLADQATVTRLARIYDGANKQGVKTTPSFLINGVNTGIHDWASLDPLLRAYAG